MREREMREREMREREWHQNPITQTSNKTPQTPKDCTPEHSHYFLVSQLQIATSDGGFHSLPQLQGPPSSFRALARAYQVLTDASAATDRRNQEQTARSRFPHPLYHILSPKGGRSDTSHSHHMNESSSCTPGPTA